MPPLFRFFALIYQVYAYDDAEFDKTLDLIDETSEYGLTGSMYVFPPPFLCPVLTQNIKILTNASSSNFQQLHLHPLNPHPRLPPPHQRRRKYLLQREMYRCRRRSTTIRRV